MGEMAAWIQLKKHYIPSEWIPREVAHMNGKKWAFVGIGSNLEFEPKSNKVNEFLNSSGCNYYHKTTQLQVCLSYSDKTDDVDLTLCYLPKSENKTNLFFRENGPWPLLRSYIWKFDICLVKMVFRDKTDETKAIIKSFHLDSGSGPCESRQFYSHSLSEELTHFQKSGFLSKAELEAVTGYKMEYGKPFVALVDLEFRARLYLCPLLQDKQLVECDDNCLIDAAKIQLFQSDKLSVPCVTVSPFVPKTESNLKFLDVSSDVTFEIMSTPVQKIGAHFLILAAQSPVFSKMLTTNMLEKKMGVIQLESDTLLDSFKLFVACLYEKMGLRYFENPAGNKSLDEWTVELTLAILQLAHKYQVEDLTDFCVENIISRPNSEFNSELAVMSFKAGMLYGKDDLKQRSIEWIKMMRWSSEEVKKELSKILKQNSADADICHEIFLSMI